MSKDIDVKINGDGFRDLAEQISDSLAAGRISVLCPNCGKEVVVHSLREVCPCCGEEFELKFKT